jgi:hypothetical protein
MKRITQEYTRIAKQEFLEGTQFKTPVEAVLSGKRSIEQWCDCINAHRQQDAIPTEHRNSSEPLSP